VPTRLDPAELETRYPGFVALPLDLASAFAALSAIEVPEGATLFDEGTPCRGFPLVLAGGVRVAKRAANGREIVLYRVGPGEGCVLSSGCLLGHQDYRATGTAEGRLRLALLPRPLFDEAIARVPAFRSFVFALFNARLAELAGLVEEVAFRRLDQRLAAWLIERSERGARPITATHQAIADELGSVREIVSRVLGHLAVDGLITTGRGRIEVRDLGLLGRMAAD
jgi:CRP/FNR family transcriptional regulator